MKQSTTFACVANKFSKVLQGYTKGIRFVAVLTVLLTMGIGQVWGADETLSCTKGTISNNTMTFSTTNFTFVHAKGSSSNFAAYTPWRVYANNTVTITAGSGVASIDKIEIVHSSTYYSTITSSSGSVTMANTSGGTTTINSTSGKTVTLTVTGTSQSRWSSIKVTYTPTASDTKVTVSKGSVSNGSISLNKTSVTTTSAAQSVTVTCTPNTGYYTKSVSATKPATGSTPTYGGSGNSRTVTYSKGSNGSSTITATFSPQWQLRGTFNNWGTTHPLTSFSGNIATVTVDLQAMTEYTFKFVNVSGSSEQWYGNTGAIITDISNWEFSTSIGDNARLYTGPAGTYTFKFNVSTKALQVIYPTVTHPAEGYAYFQKQDLWNGFKVYNYTSDNDRLSDWNGSPSVTNTTTICGKTYYYTALATQFQKVIFRDNGSNQWKEINVSGYSGKYCGDDYNANPQTWKAFNKFSITFNSNGGSGTMSTISGICPGDNQTLPANTFSQTGYTFDGWATSANGNKVYNDEATISNINSNITLYARWKANTYTITSTLTNCSSSPAIPTSYTYTGSAANLSYTITAASGYRLPDAITVSGCTYTWDKTTGQLKLTGTISGNVTITIEAVKVHTITWKVNKETYTTGSPTTSVDDGATYKNLTLPTTTPANNTLDECYTGKKFVGWSTTNIGSRESDKPTILFKTSAEAPNTAITENTTLYAVFATETPTTSKSTATTAISGAASGTITTVLSWSSAQNEGTATTAWLDDHFRLYPNKSNGKGSSITITPKSGITIDEVVLTATSSTYAKPVKYNIDGGSDVSGTWNGTKMTISDINATSSFKFRNAHTGANNDQVRVTVSVTYLKETNSTETSNYVTECCTLNNINLDNSGTTTGGTFSATTSKACEGEEITLSAEAANCYAFVSWTIKKTSDGSDVTNSVLDGNTLTMPDYAVTVYATFKSLSVTEITLSMTGGHQNLDVGQTNQLLVRYTPENATCDKEIVSWTSSNDLVISVDNTGLVTANMAGNATITAKTAGEVSATYNITVNNPTCDSWYIHYWNNSTSGDECFYKVKPDDPNDHEWRTGNFSLPSFSDEDKFIVNNTPEDPYKTDQVFRTGIGFADIQRGGQNCGTHPYPGQDAYGQLSIYDDSETANRYIAFYPAQYLVTYGKEGAAPWEVLPLNNTTGYEYESEPFMVPNGYKTDDTYKYYVGITDKNGNIKYVGYEFGGVEYKKSSVDPMNTVNGLSANDMAGKWGVWHIYSNSCANNWYCEFIHYYRVDFDLNGGEGEIAPRYGKATTPYVTFSTTDITDPTRDGYTFLGWKDQNNKIYAPTDATVTINNDLTLTALWVEEYGSNNCRWEEVSIDDIVYGDEVVIATYKNGYTYALKDNDGGASTAPLAVEIKINSNRTINTEKTPISNALIWNIDYDKEGTKNLVIYSTRNAGKWLYSINDNDGVRIGDNTNKEFKIMEGTGDDAGNIFLYHIAQSRYLGVYYTNREWCGYTTINIKITGQTLKFYKKVCLPEGQYRVTWDANGGQWSDGSTTKEEVYAEGATINKPDKPKRDGYEFTEWAPNPTTMSDENTTFTAQWAELYTVNFYSNGIEVCSFEEIAGQTVNCTNTPTTCDDEYPHFIGWTDTEIDGVATDKPALVTLPLTVSESQDYHAVFAKGTLATGGDAETVTFANSGYSNQQTISTVTLTNATITFAKGSNNNNAPTYYESGYAIRCYGGNTFTVTSNNEITEISFTFASGEGSNAITANVGTYSNDTWTGSAKSITFTIDGSSGHRRIASISVTAGSPENLTEFITSCCTPWTAPTLSANTSIAVGGTTTITYSGTTYGDVTYTSSNADVATVDADGKVSGVKPGETTITASWDGVDGSGNYCPAEATIDVTVTGSFTITYDANHASATGATTATTIAYPTGQGTVATNGFALAEHQFVKWNSSADGSGTSYSEGASITLTDDITLYAIWQRYCTVTYVIPAGGGTLAAGATTTVVAGGAVQMPGIENNSIDLEYSCEELIGWTTNSATHEAAGLKPDPFYAIGASLSGITQNTTLYAVYSRAGNGLGGTVTLTAEEMEGWAIAQSYGTERELTTCVGTWKTTGVKSTGNPIQLRATDNPYVEFPELQGNITQVVLNATNGSNATLTSGTFTLKTIDGQTITSASVNSSGVCTLTVTGSYKTARLYSSVTARIANISISYGPAAIISTTLDCSSDVDECTITYDLNESFLAAGTQVLGSCHNSTFKFSEVGTYTICSEPQANEYKLIGWNNQCDGKGSLTYTPGQEITSLPQNIITLYAQWAPEVIVHDSYEETKVYPTAMGGSITLNSGQYACDPKKYDFIGWTTDDPQLWQQNTTPPALLTDNGDGTVTFTPEEPSHVYAVYAIEDLANSDAFKLSSIVEGKKYYVGFSEYRDGRVITVSTEEAALTFYKEETTGDDNYLISYIIPATAYNDPGTKQYLYYYEVGSTKQLQITTNPDVNQGWTLVSDEDGYKFRSIQYPNVYLSMTSGNVQTNGYGNVFNMGTVAEYKYIAKTNCSENVTITFVPGNGTMTPNTNPVTAKTGDIITLPTCTYEGWTFLGWVTENIELTELEIDPSRLYTGTYEVGNSDVTLYAYYTQTPTPADFDGTTSGTWKMYTEVSTDVYKYALSHGSSSPNTLSSTEYCPNATEWTFTNTGEANVYYIQDEDNLYLTPEPDNTQLYFTSTPFPWKIVKIADSDGYRIYKYDTRSDDYNRLIMSNSNGLFYHSAKINEKNSYWYHVTIGGCTNPVYTTDPQPSKIISLVGSPMITSTIEQTVKASQKLQLVIKDMDANADVTIAADGLTFYDTDNNVVNNLQTGSNGSLTATFTVAYTPTVADNQIVNPTITVTCGSTVRTFYNVSCRSLPATFAIVAKVGNIWYALPSQGLNSTTPPAAYPVEVDDMADPTAVTAVPENADWSLRQVYASSGSNDRFTANGDNLVFVNNASPAMTLNASSSEEKNYLLTDAQYNNYYSTNPGLYEWTPTTTDLETYQLTNAQRTDRELSIDILTRFGVYAGEITDMRFLPIQNRYTPAALQVVEWKENSVVIMYNGDPAQTATLAIDGTTAIGSATLNKVNKDVAIYELPASGLMNYATKRLLITIGSSKKWLTIPYIINNGTTDVAVLNSTNTTKEVAAVTDVVVLNDATFTAAGTKKDKYTFRTIHVYGGGKLVVPSEATEGLGIYSLVMRSGTIENGTYTNSYPQLVMNGKYSNTSGIYLDYITTYERYYALSVPYSVKTKNIKYPADIYGDNLKDGGNKASFALQYYDGVARATGASGWKDFDESGDDPTLIPYQGYTFWGAPRKVSVNGGAMERQKYGIHRIQLGVGADALLTAENSDKNIDIIAYEANRPNDMGWNFLGNPYLAQYGGLSASDEDVQVGLLEQEMVDGRWTGGWKHIGELRYITTTTDGQNYTAVEVDKATFSPFNTFFIQAATKGALSFVSASRAQSLPARHYAAQQEAAKEITTGIILTGNDQTDRTGLLIAENFTEEYDFNADLSKFENSGINLYTIGKDGKLAFMAINQALAEQPIPLGYSAPTDGEYTIAFDEDRYNATDISALYLIDYDRNEKTNLLHTDYSFVTAAGTNNKRFALQVAFIPQNATSVEWVDDATIQVAVDGNNLLLNNLPTDAAVQVFDALGRLMYHAPTVPTDMQLTLPTGYYLVRIANKQHTLVIDTVIP